MIEIHPLKLTDAPVIAAAFSAIGWKKPEQQYKNYFQQQLEGKRQVLCAWIDQDFAGYVTVLWESNLDLFKAKKIPEINDLNVLPSFRRHGIASKLMDEAERICFTKGPVVGIGVGLTADYGAAQRMYVKRNYIPVGNGVFYHDQPVSRDEKYPVDDDLVLYLTKPEIKI